MYVEKENIMVYWFQWLDTSQIAFFDLGNPYADYRVEDHQIRFFNNEKNEAPIYQNLLMQSRKSTDVTWSIQSIDLILGLVGGISAIAWGAIGMFLASYQDFKFQHNLIGSMYATAPQKNEDEPPLSDRQEAQLNLESTVHERGKFYYTYSAYYFTWMILTCCPCFINKDSLTWKRRKHCYDRYENAVERMNKEVDIMRHISNLRVSMFMSKLSLNKHQRALVGNFEQYTIDDMVAEDD